MADSWPIELYIGMMGIIVPGGWEGSEGVEQRESESASKSVYYRPITILMGLKDVHYMAMKSDIIEIKYSYLYSLK